MGRKWNIICLLFALLLLTGCSLRTLDALYQVPKRSDEFQNLQSAIDRHLGNLEYCAPLSGENLQAVQAADLDGDGNQEYLLFAKGNAEKPLQILIFHLVDQAYVLADTIQSYGSAFDSVEYAYVNDKAGYELIVGCQISDQVARSVCVYSFVNGKIVSLMDTNYSRFLSCDLTADGRSELLVLRTGETEEDNGLVELFAFKQNGMERVDQVMLSEPVDQVKRIDTGKLQGGRPAVYVASSAASDTIVTDVFAVVKGQLTNISMRLEGDTCVKTLQDHYLFADDIDGDGVMELPALVKMKTPTDRELSDLQYLVRWYAITADGQQVDKLYTCHNLQGSWYMTLDENWAERVVMLRQGSSCEFYVWDEGYTSANKIMTVYYLVGTSREELASKHNRFVLYEGETVVYAANLDVNSVSYGLTQDSVIESFHLLQQDGKAKEVSR